MENNSVVPKLLVIGAVVVVLVAGLMMYHRKRRQTRSASEAARDKAEAEQRQKVEQEALRRAEEYVQQKLAVARSQLEEEWSRVNAIRSQVEEERQRFEEEYQRLHEEVQKRAEEEQSYRVEEDTRLAAEEQRRCESEAGYRQLHQEWQNAVEALRRAEEECQRLKDKLYRLEKEAEHRAETQQPHMTDYQTTQSAEEVDESRHETDIHSDTEAVQPEVDDKEHHLLPVGPKPIDPIKRGGRPRTWIHRQEQPAEQETKVPGSNPEIICWKRERRWILAVEVPEELLENSGLVVLQNTSPLTRDEFNENCWLLEQLCGQVVVRCNEDGVTRETIIALGEEQYMPLKLSGRDHNEGRRVKSPSSGSYLVVVPDNWRRDEGLSGPPPVAPESVFPAGYQAHFFTIEQDDEGKIAFCTSMGTPIIIESKASRFELVGTRLYDANEKMGLLFGEKPPLIRARDDRAWTSVKTIVVGEEGSGRRRWRTQFAPITGQMEQELPVEVTDRKSGWYFLRFYDTNTELLESRDFRFLSTFKQIRCFQPPPLPQDGGHQPVRVEVLHEAGCTVRSRDDSRGNVQIESEEERTLLIIPADPTYDETQWLLCPQDGAPIEITTLVERVWWALDKEDVESIDWRGQPLSLSRDDFSATSGKAIGVRFPRLHWTNMVSVGFERIKARNFSVKVTEQIISIPLRDFGDTQELRSVGHSSLRLWIEHQGTTYMANLGELTVKIGCQLCDFSAFSEEDIFSHVESFHMEEYFSPLTYEEMRKLIPSLPSGIYKCDYCDFYVKSDSPLNPNDAIYRHIERDCPQVDRSKGPPPKIFRAIRDVDEIRQNVIRDLEHIHKCSECNHLMHNATQSFMMSHLIDSHRNRLYEFR